ncbi:hypothetical protein RYX36_010083 [Vicia faba]
MEKKSLAVLSFLFLVLFVAQEIAVTEANCENLSAKYKGPCFTNGSCDDHCKNKEKVVGGRCRDDFRCWCTYRNC